MRGINTSHIVGVGAREVACAFSSSEDEDATREPLHGLGHLFVKGESVVVNVDVRPGGLADVAERLARARPLAGGARSELMTATKGRRRTLGA